MSIEPGQSGASRDWGLRFRLEQFGYRYSRKGRQQLREVIHEREQRAELERGFEQDLEWAGRAISAACGMDKADAIGLLRLHDSRPFERVKDASASLLGAFDRSFPAHLEKMRQAVGLYERWLLKLEQNTALPQVLAARLDPEKFSEALEKVGAPVSAETLGDGSELEMRSGESFAFVMLELEEQLQRQQSGFVVKLEEVCAALQRLFLTGNPHYHQRFAEDLVTETRISAFGSGDRDVIPHSERYARRHFALFSTSDLVCSLMCQAAPDYEALAGIDPRGSLLAAACQDRASPADYLHALRGAAERAAAAGVKLSSALLMQLLRAAKPTAGIELLDCIAQTPAMLPLFESLKKCLRPGDFAAFVLGEKGPELSAQRAMAEQLPAFIAREKRPQPAALLISSEQALWGEAEFEAVWRAAQAREGSGAVLEAYLMGRCRAQPCRALMAAIILQQSPAPVQLRKLGEKLCLVSEKSLDWVAAQRDPAQALAHFAQMTGASKEKGPDRSQAAPCPSWLTDLREKAAQGRAHGLSPAVLDQALAQLPESSRSRIRNIWQSKPDLLPVFCAQCAALGGHEAFQLLLDSPDLFQRFTARLEQHDRAAVTRELTGVCQALTDNPYRALASWLRGSRLDVELAAFADKGEIEQVSAAPGIDKIIVVGGKFKGEAAERILKAAPPGMALELYCDMRRPDLRALTERTLVVWMTPANSHSDHDVFKRQAARTGARFCYYTRSGAAVLADSLGALAGNIAKT